MRLPKNVNYLIFFFLIVFSSFLRAGYTPQHGGDTWSNYVRVITIAENGAATWVLNPLSFFGWFPYSYPTGEQILLSGITQTTGLETDTTVYLTSTLFGIFGIFAVYILARTIKKDDLFIIVTILSFSSFEWVANITWNSVSQRGLFIMLYPLTIYFLIKAYTSKERRPTHIALATFSTIALATIHRIILLFFGTILIPYFALLGILHLKKKYHFTISSRSYTASIFVAFGILFLLQVQGFTIMDFSDAKGFKNILPGDGTFATTFNLGATYGTNYGISAVLSPIGLFYLIQNKQRTFGEYFLIVMTFVSILFIMDVQYFRSFFPPVAAILTGTGIIFLFSLHRKGNKKLASAIWIILLLISIQFFEWYVENNNLFPFIIGGLGFLGTLFMLFHGLEEKRDGRKEIFVILISIVLISSSFVIATLPMQAAEYYDEYPGDGKISLESQGYAQAIWVREYAQGPFISDNGGPGAIIWGVSGVPSASSYLEVVDNKMLKSNLNPEFNLSLIIENKQNAFDYDIPRRYDPKLIEADILRGEEHIASMYKVNYIIYNYKNSEFYHSGEEDFIEPFFNDIRYPLYVDNNIQIIHYNYFEE